MGRRKATGTRISGPHFERGRWRVIVRVPDGPRECKTFADQAAAQLYADGARDELGAAEVLTVAEAQERYEQHLTAKGNRATTVATTMARLAKFLAPLSSLPLPSLTARQAGAVYRAYADATIPKGPRKGQPQHAVDTHRNALAEAKTFARWCVKAGLATVNAFEAVEGTGARKRGKPQLRVDELRVLAAHCHRLAQGDKAWRADGALAILVALYLGLRASELVGLKVRDLDDDGHLLWVASERGKTMAARRLVEVPHQLRPLLVARCKDRGRDEYLLPADGKPDGALPHERGWVRDTLHRELEGLSLPLCTAHALRGAVATIAASAGTVGQIVADQLGHESYSQTEAAYASPGSVQEAKRRTGLRVLSGRDNRPVSVPNAKSGDGRK